ncbi:MAG: right-handed parallel beta-helix repeat-containing protein [Planctomycetes bacterium]|nr:right-handed parallel beta-helix repeat-containing protein [Planctomycetota bacterium]
MRFGSFPLIAARAAVCAFAWLIAPLAWAHAVEADYFVAPDGNDAWSGRLAEPNAERTDGPFATIVKARNAIRAGRATRAGRDARPITVLVRGGVYRLDRPIEFAPEDSGTADAPVVYQAYRDERPVLSGGRRIDGWTVNERGHWVVELPDVKAGSWRFTQLFADQQRRYRPRLPKRGYYSIAEAQSPSPKAAGKGHDRFRFAEGQLDPNWHDLPSVEIIAFHEWATSRLRIAEIDAANRVVTLHGHTMGDSPWARLVAGHRFLIENVFESLSEPGEFHVDHATGRLTYVPKQGESPDRTEIVAPFLPQLVLMLGDVAQRRWVEHVHLKGLTFAHANWATPPEGQSFPQAEMNLGAAVALQAARHVVLERCVVRHTGEYAIGIGPGCRWNRIESCEMVDLGAGGIKIGHALATDWGNTLSIPSDEEALVSHQTVRDCTIAHGGRLHPAGIGVWIGHSPHNIVEHNDVHDFYYSGFSVGWSWGYGASQAHHNEIAFNHVHDIGQGVLSDMGGIYTLGISPGTTIHDNVFHDITSYSYGGWGLYTDEGSTGIVMRNNLVYRCSRASFHQHYGRENRIENNILAFAGEQQIQRTRTEPHTSFFFERNIIFWDNDNPLLGSNWADNNFRMDRNLYFRVGGKPIVFPGGLSIEQWREQRKQDEQSVVADPGFINTAAGDFRLKADSPALRIGFEPFDPSRAGRRTPRAPGTDLPPVPRAYE